MNQVMNKSWSAMGGLLLASALLLPTGVLAQQKIAYVDSEYILGRTPDYATVQQQVDRMAQGWQAEVEKEQQSVDELFQEYQARELLYTNEERQRRRQDIIAAEERVERLRMQYFGPEGELFTQQERLMRPLQERVLGAVERVAQSGGYDYVFDKSGDFIFLYTREQYNLSDEVLEELGIEVENAARGGRP
jgi:outer membrane protein